MHDQEHSFDSVVWIIWKEIFWKYSIQSLETADSVLLSLFMRDSRMRHPSRRLAPGWTLDAVFPKDLFSDYLDVQD